MPSVESQSLDRSENIKTVRVREHVNPLGKKYQTPTPPPTWTEVYTDWSKPLSLDIGCGKGGFILQMAQLKPDWNFLGLEIREPLVHRALAIKQDLESTLSLGNLHYLFCNVNVSLPNLLPKGKIQQVTIQFPDPWFKRRQHKRRTVQPELVAILGNLLAPQAEILLQSDILPVAAEMMRYFEADARFINLAGKGKFADDSIYPEHIITERESWVIQQGGDIYRCRLEFAPTAEDTL